MNLKLDDQPIEVSAFLRPGKDEMNFAEFPIALLTDRVPKGQKSIKFEDQIYDERRRKVITRRRIIEGSEEYGLPTATDDAVVLALIQLTKQKGNFARRDVEFTRHELIKMLGWTNDGKNYDRIKLSLLRIQAVNYVYDNAWWDVRLKTWTTKAFHIIDTVEINDSRNSDGQDGLFGSRIVWGDAVFDSFQSGFLRNIDFQLCMRLEHPIALRMYRFLGKRFHVKPEWVFDIKEFAYDHIGLGRNYEGGTQIARKLKPAIEELEAVGFLELLREDERFIKNGRDWSIRFGQKLSAAIASPQPEQEATPEVSAEVEALVARGITAKTAAELAQTHSAEIIHQKIDVLDWLVSQGDKRIGQSPEGYLVKSIRDDYKTPKGYVSKADRDRAAAAVRQRQKADEAKRRQEHELANKGRAIAAKVAAYREAATADQLAQLEADAITQADEESLRSLHDPAMKAFRKTLIHRMTDEHIARLIEAEPEPV